MTDNSMSINILQLYPDLLNLYGDKGNIECMRKRLAWRGIDVSISSCTTGNDDINVENADIIFLGGGSDREQETVCARLLNKKKELSEYVENGGAFVAVCGGYHMLGNYYEASDRKIEGLGILDIYTELPKNASRLIGNVVLDCDGINHKVVGFENHSGRTCTGTYTPLGKVLFGHGNNGESGFEGVRYKNLIGTNLHGPLFPKNPELCDDVLLRALKQKYGETVCLDALDDELELKANNYMVKKLLA